MIRPVTLSPAEMRQAGRELRSAVADAQLARAARDKALARIDALELTGDTIAAARAILATLPADPARIVRQRRHELDIATAPRRTA